MTKKVCCKCNFKTPSLISTPEGDVCLNCYYEKPGTTKEKRKVSHEESDIQTEFFNQVPIFFPNLPDKLLFAVPNGGSRNKAEAKRMKGEGVKRGVSDVILLIPKKGYASLCLEFKTKQGRQSDDQKEFQHQVEMCGSKYVLVRSAAKAIKEMKKYLA